MNMNWPGVGAASLSPDARRLQQGQRTLLSGHGIISHYRSPAAVPEYWMRVQEALLYCRQLLFEQRMTAIWIGGDRLEVARALQRWRDSRPEHRQAELELMRRRLAELEGVATQLRADNNQLREELYAHQQRELEERELGDEIEQRAEYAEQRAAAQEAALRARLAQEERRLAESSTQLAALEAFAETDAIAIQARHVAEARRSQGRREGAISTLRAARALGVRFMGRAAWLAAMAHARLLITLLRHEAEQRELDERQDALQALRESREALEWRVRQSKAECIVMASEAEKDRERKRGRR